VGPSRQSSLPPPICAEEREEDEIKQVNPLQGQLFILIDRERQGDENGPSSTANGHLRRED